MNLAAELVQIKADPGLPASIAARLDALLEQAQTDTAQAEQLRAEVAQLNAVVAAGDAALKASNLKIQALALELAHHRRIRFSVKSEAMPVDQRDLFQETWNVDLAAIEAEVEQEAERFSPKPKRPRAGRQPLPDHLPRIEYRHEPASCACGQCGRELVKIGEDITEQLDCEPSRFFVHRHIRPQYACRSCETVVADPIPPAVIDGGMAASGLLAWVVVSKFVEHLPLYRLEQIAARQNVILSRATQAEWVGRIGVALQPLADRLSEMLRQRPVLHADETPIQQLDPGRGKTLRAYLWAYRSNALETGPPIVVFDYQPSRSGSHAAAFLQDWRGHLMVDDYSGYKALFRGGITELACMVHSRRKFFELHKDHQSVIAGEALRRIAELYEVEDRAKHLDHAGRLAMRQAEAKPKLEAYGAWLTATRRSVADGSGTAKAIDYTLGRWAALMRYVESGSLPIDNNPCHAAIGMTRIMPTPGLCRVVGAGRPSRASYDF